MWDVVQRSDRGRARMVHGISIGARAKSKGQVCPRLWFRLASDVIEAAGLRPGAKVVVSIGRPGTPHAGQIMLGLAQAGDAGARSLIKDNRRGISYTYHVALSAHWLDPNVVTVGLQPLKWAVEPSRPHAIVFPAPGWALKGYAEWLERQLVARRAA